jgi:4a-hydroxytetrahydrobiopterin dehydratase
MNLSQKKCIPCQGGVEPFDAIKISQWLEFVAPGWTNEKNHHLSRKLTLKNFKEVVALVNQIADLAEKEGHHPDLNIHGYKNLTITIFTHKINGLWDSDFILAAKIDELINDFE